MLAQLLKRSRNPPDSDYERPILGLRPSQFKAAFVCRHNLLPTGRWQHRPDHAHDLAQCPQRSRLVSADYERDAGLWLVHPIGSRLRGARNQVLHR